MAWCLDIRATLQLHLSFTWELQLCVLWFRSAECGLAKSCSLLIVPIMMLLNFLSELYTTANFNELRLRGKSRIGNDMNRIGIDMNRVELPTGCSPISRPARALFGNNNSTLSSHSVTHPYRLSINFVNDEIIGA
jgi:hypothetical protein